MHPLDTPVWHALRSHLSPIAQGDERALRCLPHINLFGAAAGDSEQDLRALAALYTEGETMFTLQARHQPSPPGMELRKAAPCLQLLAERAITLPACQWQMQVLGAEDAQEMLALAELTAPGPFRAETWRMGTFYGVRIEGRLAAMAGMRMHLPGYREVSGVCTHPDFRGLGLARALSAKVAAQIQAAGEQPFLHAWLDNQAAIKLYQDLGFVIRCEMQVAVYRKLAEKVGEA